MNRIVFPSFSTGSLHLVSFSHRIWKTSFSVPQFPSVALVPWATAKDVRKGSVKMLELYWKQTKDGALNAHCFSVFTLVLSVAIIPQKSCLSSIPLNQSLWFCCHCKFKWLSANQSPRNSAGREILSHHHLTRGRMTFLAFSYGMGSA